MHKHISSSQIHIQRDKLAHEQLFLLNVEICCANGKYFDIHTSTHAHSSCWHKNKTADAENLNE